MPVTPYPQAEGKIELKLRQVEVGYGPILLPHDLEWTDEGQWSPTVQNVDYAISGNVYVQQGVRLAGRYITLQGQQDMAWINRYDVDRLIAMRDFRREMTLTMTYDYLAAPRVFNVIFRYHEQPFDYNSVLGYQTQKGFNAMQDVENWFILSNLRLMEVPINSVDKLP